MEAAMNLMTFEDAIKASSSCKKRHVLLGNGFSIACRSNIFRYESLLNQADFAPLSPAAKESFAKLKTADFERVIRGLRDSASLAETYGATGDVASRMRKDADDLKELLVMTIAASHPERPSDISDAEYAACNRFLKHFETVYTLNYDLLLYWAKMKALEGMDSKPDDGFRAASGDFRDELDYVVWEAGSSHGQNVWYLHGALHVFDSGPEVRKYTWRRTGVRLIELTRSALREEYFPLFVAEGQTDEKLERIRHNEYLAKASRSFGQIGGCLFIFGHSLAPNDEHILRLIEKGKVTDVYVGIFGSPETPDNRRIINRAEAMTQARDPKRPLQVSFYNSQLVKPWGK
jgi:hypothetical protein